MSVAPPREPHADVDPPGDPSPDASGSTDDAAWAGRVVFPTSALALRSTRGCPACQTPLTGLTCARCGLDLDHPAAIELAEVSARAADLLDARVTLIGRLRRATAQRAIAAHDARGTTTPVDVHAAPAPALPASLPPKPQPLAGGDRGAAAAAPHASGAARRERSGVQIALTVVGISLLGVFAVFGLVYAFVTYGQTVRMLIVAAGTLAVLATAAALSRRGLSSTAEGLAVLGTIVLVLDAWALRANDPLGLGDGPDALYWGWALLIVGAISAAWSRLGSLGAPALGAALLTPLGAGMLAFHLAEPLDDALSGALASGTSLACGALTAALVALAHPVLVDPSRRLLSRATGAIAGIAASIAIITGLVAVTTGVDDAPVALLLSLVLAAAAGAHAALLLRREPPIGAEATALARGLAALGVVTAVVGAAAAGVRLDESVGAAVVPVIVATALAAALERARSRRPHSARRPAVSAALISAAVLAAASAGIAAIIALGGALEAVLAVGAPLGVTATSVIVRPEPIVPAALAALALAAGILAASWGALGVLRSRARALTPILGGLVVASLPLLGSWVAVVSTSAIVALVASITLHRVVRVPARDDRRALVAGLAPVAIGGGALALLVAPAVDGAWIIGVVAALVVIAICRALPARRWVRAFAVGGGAAIVVASAAPFAADLREGRITAPTESVVIALGALVVLVAALGRLTLPERRSASAVAAVLAAAGAASLADPLGLGIGADDPAAAGAVAVGFGLAVLALAVVVLRAAALRTDQTHDREIESLVSAALLPIAVALGVAQASLAIEVDRRLAVVLQLLALVVVSAVSLAARLRGPDAPRRRVATDSVIGVVVALIVLEAIVPGPGSAEGPLALITAAVAVLLLAIDRDGLAASGSSRRHAGWAALALAVLALWTQLTRGDATEPEPYVLPVAGALLLIAAWIKRSRGGATAGLAALVGGALMLAGAPVALASGDEPLVRGAAVAVIALLIGLAAAHRRDALEERVRGLTTALAAAALVSLAALAVASVPALSSSGRDSLDQVRAVLLVVLLAGLALGSWLAESSRERSMLTAGAAGLAALSAAALGLAAVVEPVELVSLPVALAALAIGVIALERDPEARSGLWLSPGLVLLLVPSLIAVESSPELWRVIALGVVALAVFVGGISRRLRAPVLVGGIVLLIHLVVQSWPLLERVGESVEWWLWLGLAGAAVVAIAARYERRLQDARALVRRIRDLR